MCFKYLFIEAYVATSQLGTWALIFFAILASGIFLVVNNKNGRKINRNIGWTMIWSCVALFCLVAGVLIWIIFRQND
jgi:heme/copper-type cytochrome/quinol oxidase subunit 2